MLSVFHLSLFGFGYIFVFSSVYSETPSTMSIGRSPRSATHLVHHLDASPLMVAADVTDARGLKAPKTLLSEYLWQQTQQHHNQALQSGFVQGIRNASLNPEGFGGYMLQDSVFCYKASNNIAIAESNATDPFIKHFLEKRYYHALFNTWHIEDASGIKLGQACAAYIAHEHNVAMNLNSVYFVVALIPCAKLWPWIGQQIAADTGNFGVYTKWVQENFSPDSSGVTKYETLINNAEAQGVINRNEALEIYRTSMMGEVNFFGSIKTILFTNPTEGKNKRRGGNIVVSDAECVIPSIMSIGRSPRSTTYLVHHLDANPLMVASDVTDAMGLKAPEISLSKFRWEQTQQHHNQALQSGFVQGIRNASLNPEGFGKYTMKNSFE
ncbi:hypothetical protein MAR_008728 [Mya arenaria]|uniref:Uncharacterized protein n=1 Tax=Mya arenaria TaxID=6604 RepID=A0ABY7DZQ9_MYAAR|nr:hypothetical protein MAR_008728 [Mya arenaria]